MSPSPASLIIRNARLVTDGSAGLSEAELPVRDLAIIDGLVSAELPADGSCPEIDAAGRVVIPGLIDAHFHAYAVGMGSYEDELGPLSYAAINGAGRLGRALRRGFTTVRDVAGGDLGLAKAVERGLIDAPRYRFTGPALSQTGGHGDPRSAEMDVCFGHGHMVAVVDGVDALRVAVRERLRTGAHAIKIMTSGGVVSLTDPIRIPQYSPEEVRAVVEEASRRGTYVAAHAYSPEAIRHSVENGVRSIEHGNLLDAETAALMAEHGAFLVPTLAAYDAMDRRGHTVQMSDVSRAKNREVLDSGKDAIRLALAAGVRVGFGSDLMGDLEDDQLVGVRLQEEAVGAAATLRSMTAVNAELLGDAEAGRLSPGGLGDAVILDTTSLEELSAIWDESRPRTVVIGGRIVR